MKPADKPKAILDLFKELDAVTQGFMVKKLSRMLSLEQQDQLVKLLIDPNKE